MTNVGGEADGWSPSAAAAWEQRRDRAFERHRLASEWLVDHVDPRPGATVLELAAGPGETGFLAAERVGPTGKLISTDFAPGMVEAAARGAKARGLANVECRVMDAQQLDLADGSVDGVLCRFALMLMPDPRRVMSEARRVLRGGGRFAYAVFGRADSNPWITVLVDAIREAGHRLSTDMFEPGGSFFSLSDHDRNRDLLTAAGFPDVHVEEIAEPRVYDDFDEYWDHHTHATVPIAALVSSLSSEQTESIRAALRPMVTPFQTDSGFAVPSLVVVACGA